MSEDKVKHFWKYHNPDNMDKHAVRLINQLQSEVARLKDLLGELYDYASYCDRGSWILIDDRDLEKKIKQALHEGTRNDIQDVHREGT